MFGHDRIEGLPCRRVGEILFREQQHVGRLDLRPFGRIAGVLDAYRVDRVDQTNDAIQLKGVLRLVACEFIDDLARMRGAAGLNQQSTGFEIAQDVADLFAEFKFPDAAQAAAGHQANIVFAVSGLRDIQRVETRVGEFVENHDPEFIGRLS